jgi:hypothetical protein
VSDVVPVVEAANVQAVSVAVSPTVVPVWATAVLSGALTLPTLAAIPNLRAVPVVVGWTLAASPFVGFIPMLERAGTAVRYASVA